MPNNSMNSGNTPAGSHSGQGCFPGSARGSSPWVSEMRSPSHPSPSSSRRFTCVQQRDIERICDVSIVGLALDDPISTAKRDGTI